MPESAIVNETKFCSELSLLFLFLVVLGWTWECLEDWAPFSKVAVSSIFMTFIFWFCTEVGTFLAGEKKLMMNITMVLCG